MPSQFCHPCVPPSRWGGHSLSLSRCSSSLYSSALHLSPSASSAPPGLPTDLRSGVTSKSGRRIDTGSSPWPTLLWLQGGPGGSGVGIRNFQEIGPLDTDLRHRNSTWLQKADLLFVDNPVGTGYSFVEDESLFVRTDWEAATDLTTLLKKLYDEDESRQRSPLFIVAESYGGKFAVTAGLSILKAIEAGELKLKLGGLALGNSWISPEDFVASAHCFLLPHADTILMQRP
ncbi:serine carboxypeptidase-like [Musa troglodytarum]|uniref:Carboxypeptidase n=1 Tax=Musa troglodytarum TaxID=320322 RepID=A0A9E7I6J0_9LILI|nr:serine carboxypeptidase-like [Musa troglodytarum]